MNNSQYIKQYLLESRESLEEIDHLNSGDIDKAINILFEAWKKGKQVFFMGNGGSAANASHFAADLSKTTMHKEKKRFKSFCLNDNPALFTAWVNDSGWDYVYRGQLENVLQEGDVIVLLSVHGGSGWSGNIIKAAELAKERNSKIIGLAGFDGGMMKTISDACMVIPRDSTPHTEALHAVLQHLIIFRLKDLIEEYDDKEVIVGASAAMAAYVDPTTKDTRGDKK